MGFPGKDFMLYGETAKKLFFDYAKDMPIIDYHCHLDPRQIAENKPMSGVTELMLGGDHYKWRAMRSAGIDEEYITGGADDRDKFRAYAKTVSFAIGNPLYHWTHLELARYFGIDTPLSEQTADEIYDRCNAMMKDGGFLPRDLIARSGVEVVCTTDAPGDDLRWHEQLKNEFGECKVLPTFRPDAIADMRNPAWRRTVESVGAADFGSLLEYLAERIEYFDAHGCRLADHGLGTVPYGEGDPDKIYKKALAGEKVTDGEAAAFSAAVLDLCAMEYCKHDWAMQLHIGAIRNNSTRMFEKLGPDTGFDSINDLSVAAPLSALLDRFEKHGHLPKTVLYNLNPKDNYVLGSMIGNFQSAPYFGKMQFGAGWWFNDQRDGMEAQMKALANLGVLGTFVGMLTDSRSLISYPRHEYFRRIMCNLIGSWVDRGEYPEDYAMLEKIVKGISYQNAKNYFKF